MKKHVIIRMKGQHYMLTNNSAVIVEALLKSKTALTYTALSRRTKIARASLHVYVSRMCKSGLLKTVLSDKTNTCTIKFVRRATSIPTIRV